MSAVDDRPLTSDELSEFKRYRQLGRELLKVSGAQDPQSVVYAINKYVDDWQAKRRGFLSRLRSRAEDPTETARALAVMWGDQIVRQFGWEWICETRDSEERYGVASPDRALVIHAPQFISQCLEEPNTDCTVLLAFNMQAAGNFSGSSPGQYVSIMSGVRRVVPKK